jgi:hypothetical protein
MINLNFGAGHFFSATGLGEQQKTKVLLAVNEDAKAGKVAGFLIMDEEGDNFSFRYFSDEQHRGDKVNIAGVELDYLELPESEVKGLGGAAFHTALSEYWSERLS